VLFEWPSIDDVEAYVLKTVVIIFLWLVWGEVKDYCLERLFGNLGRSKIVEAIFLQV
jgi:hypothetical protein